MKRMMKLWTVVAVAAMGLVACQNNFDEPVTDAPTANSVIVKFISEETRTSVDTSGETPIFAWDEAEDFVVLEQTDALAEATSVTYTKVDGKANIDAEFAVNEGKDEYKYAAVYPKTGYNTKADNINAVTLSLPATQTMAEGSYDPNADLMVSMIVTATAQPTEVVPMRFTRLAAVAKLAIKGLSLGVGEVVERVEFTANGKDLAGSIVADLNNPHEFSVDKGVNTVTVATTSAQDVYFTLLPTTLNAGDEYCVAIATNQKVYIKQGSIPEGKSLVFEAGMVSRFGVNMADAVVADKWKLVRDASTLKEGDVVTIVSNKYDYVVGANVATNYPYASKTTITKIGDYFIHPTPANATKENMVQSFTLVKRDANRNAFDFYNGTDDYSGDANSGFLCAPGSGSQYLKILPYYSANTQFDITIENGIASIIATNAEGSSKQMIYKHSTYSTPYFCCYSSTDDSKAICLYRLEGEQRDIPTVDANVTVGIDSNEYVVILEEGKDVATAIEEVTFNYVGDWKISVEVEDTADWLNVVYDAEDNCLKYTAQPNTNPGKRTAVVTITATRGDKTLEPWTFNMLQKGAPKDISIAEFVELGSDVNTTYRLTGILTSIPSGSSNSAEFKIQDLDGNEARITFLKTDNNEYVVSSDDVELKLGDVITVTTVVTSSTKGKGGSSSYPSYYKGYYRLAVSAGVAADYTGGAVAINVATSHNGSIELPTTPVSGTMPTYDYATFAYTDGAESATVTFTTQNDTPYARKATATFTYGLISAEVTVQQGVNPANKIGWKLVTDASTLAVGDEVIIVAKNADKALAKPTGPSQSNFPVAEISKTGSVIYDIEETDTQTFVLGAGLTDGTWSFDFTYNDTGYRLYYSTQLKMRATSYDVNAATSWAITINEADGDASILSTKLLKFNGKTGTAFGVQTVGSTNANDASFAVCIYKKEVK